MPDARTNHRIFRCRRSFRRAARLASLLRGRPPASGVFWAASCFRTLLTAPEHRFGDFGQHVELAHLMSHAWENCCQAAPGYGATVGGDAPQSRPGHAERCRKPRKLADVGRVSGRDSEPGEDSLEGAVIDDRQHASNGPSYKLVGPMYPEKSPAPSRDSRRRCGPLPFFPPPQPSSGWWQGHKDPMVRHKCQLALGTAVHLPPPSVRPRRRRGGGVMNSRQARFRHISVKVLSHSVHDGPNT